MSRFKLAWFTLSCLSLIFFLVDNGLSQEKQHGKRDGRGFPDLVSGLKATKGCIGVETAQTPDGKQCIFAWFENKKAVLNWYNSDMHQGVQEAFFPDEQEYTPLKDVPDDMGPIMAIASITFSDKEHFEATNLPISQIAIELYTPVSGGLFLGSKFAPDAVKVKNMKDYTPKGKTE